MDINPRSSKESASLTDSVVSAATEIGDSIARWLIAAPPHESVRGVRAALSRRFEAWFGQRHWSWRCAWRSAVAAYLTLALAVPFSAETNEFSYLEEPSRSLLVVHDGPPELWLLLLAYFALYYFALFATRFALGRFGDRGGLPLFCWLIAEVLLKTALVASLSLTSTSQFTWQALGSRTRELVAMANPDGALLWAVYTTSAWLWLYALSGFANREKLPRSLWYPLLPEALKIEDWKEQHEEVSGSVRRVMLVLLGYSFFCLLTLGAPDASLIATNAKISVPFANTEIAFASFLLIGPLVLLGIAFYLHLFVGHWAELSRSSAGRSAIPFSFNLDNPAARIFSGFVFYWLVPLVCVGFAFKASPQPEGPMLADAALAVTLVFLLLQSRRAADVRPPILMRTLRWFVASAVLAAGVLIVRGDTPFDRQLELAAAKLQGEDLSASNLSGFDLQGAKLQNVVLRRVDLSFADLRGANLSGADLGLATLGGADVRGVDMRRVKNVTQGQLNSARGDVRTLPPEGLVRPMTWPRAELRGHQGRIRHVEYSPDGKRVVTASDDGTARVWDATTEEVLAELRGHQGSVWQAGFSPDGKRVVTASADGTAWVWGLSSLLSAPAAPGANSRHSSETPVKPIPESPSAFP